MPILLALALLGVGPTPTPEPCSTLEHCMEIVKLSDPERCVEVMAVAAHRWPNNAEIHRKAAFCLSRVGRYEEATQAAGRCLKLIAGSEPCLHEMGFGLWKLGRDQEARVYLERAVAAAMATGRFPRALDPLIGIALDEEDTAQARRDLDVAWRLATQNDTKGYLHLQESVLAMIMTDGDGALAHLAEAERLLHRPDLRLSRSFVLAWQGRSTEALTLLGSIDRLVLSHGDTEDSHWLEGVLLRRADHAQLKAWVNANPKNHRAWFLLALDSHLAGADSEACATLRAGRTRAGVTLLRPAWAAAACPAAPDSKGGS